MRCYLIDKIVDSDMINIQDLIDSIAVSCPPGYLEVAHIQYYDHVMKSFPEVKTDQDLMSMFAKHSKEKIIDMFIGYCPISETYEPISEWQFDEPTQQENNIGNDSDDDDYLRNPVPGNEHVGVDEEGMYLDSALPLVLFRDKEKDKDYVPEDDSDDDSENEEGSDDEVEEDEELVGHESTHIPNVEYDKEDPPMVEGTTYPNMKEFKLALCMHAIKHEFEFKTEKSAPHRFRAYCSRKNSDKCPWKIYASTTEDRCTVEVRKNRCAHDCSSTRRKKKVRNATRHWIWQVSGIPCKHALAFITSLPNAPIENYVDPYYSIDKFRAAYGQLVPALEDKNQWPKACHGFFMHPPLLKATAGRPKTERYKGCSENKKKKGMHQCPICKEYGHHWHNCKKGNPDDIKAMRAIRGPPKKKARTTKSAQSSIVPMEDDAPAPSMSFPPSQTLQSTSKKTGSSKAKHLDSISGTSICQNLETTGKTKGKHGNSDSRKSKRRISRSGSNQPDPISIELPPTTKQRAAPKKAKRNDNKIDIAKDKEKIHVPQFDSPAMGTRSKKLDTASPAMGTRSKRRLSL